MTGSSKDFIKRTLETSYFPSYDKTSESKLIDQRRHGRQCTYNVTLRSARANHCCSAKVIWVRISSVRYPACNAHAPYCHLWPPRLYNILPLYLINGTIFRGGGGGGGGEPPKRKYVFWLSFVWNISHSKNNWARYNQKCTMVFM